MIAGKAILECVQWIVVQLSTQLSTEEICMYIDVSKRSVERIMAHFRRSGDVLTPAPQSKHQLHQALCDQDIEVSSPFLS